MSDKYDIEQQISKVWGILEDLQPYADVDPEVRSIVGYYSIQFNRLEEIVNEVLFPGSIQLQETLKKGKKKND